MPRSKKYLWCILLILNGIIESVDPKCGSGHGTISYGSGTISAPDSKMDKESCSWTFSFPTRPTILVFDVTQIKLYYRKVVPLRQKKCTQTLKVGNYAITTSGGRCKSENTFCHVYYNDQRCENLTSTAKYAENCERFAANTTRVEFTSSGDGNLFSRARGFEMSYQYATCPTQETSTSSESFATPKTPFHHTNASITTAPAMNASDPAVSTRSESGESRRIPATKQRTTAASDANQRLGIKNDFIIGVVVGCSVILALLLAIMVFRIRRRNQRKNPPRMQDKDYNEIVPSETAETAYSVVYGRTTGFHNGDAESPSEPDACYSQVTAATNGHGLSSSTTGEFEEGSGYATLNFDVQNGEPYNRNTSTEKFENDVYSAAAEANAEPTHGLDRYEVPSHHMVENILYGTR